MFKITLKDHAVERFIERVGVHNNMSWNEVRTLLMKKVITSKFQNFSNGHDGICELWKEQDCINPDKRLTFVIKNKGIEMEIRTVFVRGIRYQWWKIDGFVKEDGLCYAPDQVRRKAKDSGRKQSR
jgi:hypothetical protein